MKDLFVFVADADAQAVLKTVLQRHQSLQIRPITFDVDRHTMRDNGMVRDGPELLGLRLKKSEYERVLLVWDYAGSGQRSDATECAAAVRARLEQVSWRDRCAAVVIVPELEEWLWHNPASIAKVLNVSAADLNQTADDGPMKPLLEEPPKEKFERVLYRQLRCKPLPRDFERIAQTASLAQWRNSSSFALSCDVLRAWFPVA